MSSNDPQWMSDDDKVLSSSDPVAGENDKPSTPDEKNKKIVTYVFLVLCMGASLMLATTGALGIGSADSVKDTGIVFVGLYLLLFALILFGFELTRITPVASLSEFYRKNFGFLYGPIGKGMFLIFIGIMAFGVEEPRSLAIATGVVVGFFGALMITVSFRWPEMFEKSEKYRP